MNTRGHLRQTNPVPMQFHARIYVFSLLQAWLDNQCALKPNFAPVKPIGAAKHDIVTLID